jgi:spore coat protein CotH
MEGSFASYSQHNRYYIYNANDDHY